MRKLHLSVAVIGIAVAGTAAWWFQQGRQGPPAVAMTDSAAPRTGPGPGASGAGRGPAAGGAPGAPPAAGRGPGGPGGPAAVEVGLAEVMRLEDDAQAVGSLRASQSVMLRPETSGRVVKLSFTDGQRVRRGQLLVQLDDTLQQAQLKQAQAQSTIARTNLQRSRELAEKNFVSQSAVDQNAAALDVAQAQVALAEAQITRMRIVAPFDAIAGIRSVNTGDYLKDGADIVALEDTSSMWVDFRLPERYISRLRTGQPVNVALDAFAGKDFTAKVEALDSQLDANGRSLLVRARLPNPQGQLKSGLFARARIVFAVREDAIVVPEEALVPQGNDQFIFKLAEGPDGKPVAQRIKAEIGARLPGKAEILKGLAAGDRVVTAGHARLRGPNVPVRVIDLSKPAEPPGGAGGKPGTSGPAGGRPGGDRPASAAGPRPASAP